MDQPRHSIVFSFKITAIQLVHPGPITGLLAGYSRYEITATILKVIQGTIKERENESFVATPLIYSGAIRRRPQGLWVGVSQNDVPKANSIHTISCRVSSQTTSSASQLISEYSPGCTLVPNE